MSVFVPFAVGLLCGWAAERMAHRDRNADQPPPLVPHAPPPDYRPAIYEQRDALIDELTFAEEAAWLERKSE